MTGPGERIIVKAVASRVNYTPSWFLHKDERGRRNYSVEIILIPPFFKCLQVSVHIVLVEELVPGGGGPHAAGATLLSAVIVSSMSRWAVLKPSKKVVPRAVPSLGC